MLDFGFSEVLLTSVIALVVLGPERLPKVARQVGNWMGRARIMARQLSEQLDREVADADVSREIAKAKAAVVSAIALEPTPPAPEPSAGTPAPADASAAASAAAATPKPGHE
jgi:sec-independent protein translocase protein TatB